METTEHIKGSCEWCGFAHQGKVQTVDGGAFPEIECPNCHKETQNFNYASEVDEQDKEEETQLDYKESTYKTI